MRAFFYCIVILLTTVCSSVSVFAAGKSLVLAALDTQQLIRQRLLRTFPEQEIVSITAEAEGALYRVQFYDGQVIYSMPTGQYFLAGELFELQETGIINLTKKDRELNRVELLAHLEPTDYLTIPVSSAAVLATIYIIVDADCYYCQLQYAETPLLSQAGVEVRYLSRSRSAPDSRLFQQVRRTWCSDNASQALDLLMQGRSITATDCPADLLMKHIRLADSMGVGRLPATITAEGQLVSGLLKAPQILKLLAIDPLTDGQGIEPIPSAGFDKSDNMQSM